MLEARGKSGRITFDGQTVGLHRDRMRAKILVGGGSKTIPIGSITAVQFKPASLLPGYIQVTIGGGNERQSKFGKTISDASHDENSVVFGNRGNDAFAAIAKAINDAILANASRGSVQMAAPVDVAGQIRQLATLRDQGLVSPQEYEAKRRELLARM